MRTKLTPYFVCLALLFILVSSVLVQAAASASPSAKLVKSTALSIFSDGSAEINQTLLPRNASSVTLPLFAAQIGNILAQDQNGSAVSYQINGRNITLSTFGITRVTLVYDTDVLTSKLGSAWDVSFDSPFNVTLTLPFQSTVLSLSSAPKSFSTLNGKPILSLASGSWQISYGLPISVSTRTGPTTTSSTHSNSAIQSQSPPFLLQPFQLAMIGAAVVALIAAAVFVARRSRLKIVDPTLRYDDKEILNFINEKGGKVSEVEIRERFSLPRTSAWRQVKRLEKLGLVRITKMGLQNQVELIRSSSEQQT